MRRQDVEANSEKFATIGTAAYMAPEMIYGRPGRCDFPLDIWSLGITILELVLKVPDYYLSQVGWASHTSRILVQNGAFLNKIVDSDLRDLLRNVPLSLSLSRDC